MDDYNATEATSWAVGGATGGSEEAVAYLATALAERGYRVHIYVDRLDLPALERGYTWYYTAHNSDGEGEDRTEANDGGGYVRWLLRRDFDRAFPFAVFIAWRTTMNLGLCPASSTGTRCILWAHDLLSASDLPPAEIGGWVVHSLWTQSRFHQRTFAAAYEQTLAQRPLPVPLVNGTRHMPPTLLGDESNTAARMGRHPPAVGQRAQQFLRLDIVPNGLPDAAFTTATINERVSMRFVYASAPNRGLQDVLEVVWPVIHTAYPMATLEVFYGLSTRHEAMLRLMLGNHPPPVPSSFRPSMTAEANPFDQWIAYLRHLMQTTPGVVYHGSVAQSVLTSTLQTAAFLLYPTAFPETGCITVLRAMAAGCIPITSRYTESVLATMPPIDYDDGPHAQPLTPTIAANHTARRHWLQTQYLPAVQAAIRRELAGDPTSSTTGSHTNRHRREAMRQYAATHHTWRQSAVIVDGIIHDLSTAKEQ